MSSTPQCKCSSDSVERTVRKQGPNTGRKFWCCANRSCGFFLWSDANVHQQSSSNTVNITAENSYHSHVRGGYSKNNHSHSLGRRSSNPTRTITVGSAYESRSTETNKKLNIFSQNARARLVRGSGTEPEAKRIRISNANKEKNSERLSTLTFDLASATSISCKVNLMWNKQLISTLQVLDGVSVRETEVIGVNEVMVPYATIHSAGEVLRDKHKMKMEYSFPFHIVERLQMLRSAHKTREKRGDKVTQPLNEILPVAICEALMEFQWEGVHFALRHGARCLIGDDMGLGKTLQAIAVARIYMSEWPLLVICPSSLRHNWKEEILRWLEDDITENDVLVIMKGSDGERPFRQVNIVSYDLIRKIRSTKLDKCKFIIADECHYLKTGTALRSKAVLPLIKRCKRALLLSGTPALSRPVELFTQVNALVPTLFPKYTEYVERYCNAHHGRFGYDVTGAANLNELHILLRASVLIRRKKDDVLTQLPAKRRQVFYVETKSTYMAKIKKCFQDLNRAKIQTQQASEDDAIGLKNKERALNTELYQLSGMAKLESVQEHLKVTADTGVKFIVFAHHQEIMDGLADYITKKLKLSFIRIDGGTPQADRQGLCKSFQEDLSVRVALLSITAAGVGLTLTAATVVLFAELYWNPGSLIQAEDRAHRIGQRDCVFVKYLLAKQTFDDSMWKTIQRKFNVIGKSLTGASATIDLATQTPEKAENVDDPIISEDDKEENEVEVVDITQVNEEKSKQASSIIDLTQNESFNTVRPARKETTNAETIICLDDMFPEPKDTASVDSVAFEQKPIDADIEYARQLRSCYASSRR